MRRAPKATGRPFGRPAGHPSEGRSILDRIERGVVTAAAQGLVVARGRSDIVEQLGDLELAGGILFSGAFLNGLAGGLKGRFLGWRDEAGFRRAAACCG